MTTKRPRKNRLPPFIPVIKATMATPAWRTMSPGARILNIELRGRLRNDYANNGKLWLSCRDAAKAIGATTQSIVRWFAENEHYGFLRKTSEGFLSSNGHGIAAHYRFTEFSHGTHPPTRDFEKWDGQPFVYTPRRSGRKKQNPVMMVSTPCDDGQHIERGQNGKSVCDDGQHIETALGCDDGQHTSRRTSPQCSGRMNQGSSMARAPVQAGDVGSSPAPVAKRPWLTPKPTEHGPKGEVIDLPRWDGGLLDHVAGVIEEQLRDHEARMAAAKAAKQEADQRATVAAQPQASLVLEALVPDVVVPAQKPMLPGDRRRAEILARNREAQQRFDAEIKERLR